MKIARAMSSVEPPAFSTMVRMCWKTSSTCRLGWSGMVPVSGSMAWMPPENTMLPTLVAMGMGRSPWRTPGTSMLTPLAMALLPNLRDQTATRSRL